MKNFFKNLAVILLVVARGVTVFFAGAIGVVRKNSCPWGQNIHAASR
jgi:hypothetical protein